LEGEQRTEWFEEVDEKVTSEDILKRRKEVQVAVMRRKLRGGIQE
jgi:hypothetical protein